MFIFIFSNQCSVPATKSFLFYWRIGSYAVGLRCISLVRHILYKVNETLSCNVKQIGKGARVILCKKQLNVRFDGCNVFTFLTLHCAVRLWKLGKGVYLSQDCGKSRMELGALFVHREDILWVSHVIMN